MTAASPGSIALIVGDTQIVTLNGSHLGQLSGAHITRGGVAFPAVQAQLLPASGPTTRQLRLIATASAGPPWGVPLTLMVALNNHDYAVPMLLKAIPALPDLVLTSCTATQSLNALKVRATIGNNDQLSRRRDREFRDRDSCTG